MTAWRSYNVHALLVISILVCLPTTMDLYRCFSPRQNHMVCRGYNRCVCNRDFTDYDLEMVSPQGDIVCDGLLHVAALRGEPVFGYSPAANERNATLTPLQTGVKYYMLMMIEFNPDQSGMDSSRILWIKGDLNGSHLDNAVSMKTGFTVFSYRQVHVPKNDIRTVQLLLFEQPRSAMIQEIASVESWLELDAIGANNWRHDLLLRIWGRHGFCEKLVATFQYEVYNSTVLPTRTTTTRTTRRPSIPHRPTTRINRITTASGRRTIYPRRTPRQRAVTITNLPIINNTHSTRTTTAPTVNSTYSDGMESSEMNERAIIVAAVSILSAIIVMMTAVFVFLWAKRKRGSRKETTLEPSTLNRKPITRSSTSSKNATGTSAKTKRLSRVPKSKQHRQKGSPRELRLTNVS